MGGEVLFTLRHVTSYIDFSTLNPGVPRTPAPCRNLSMGYLSTVLQVTEHPPRPPPLAQLLFQTTR